ncbi:malate dehydrogenase [Sulfurospirillum multivorans]|uniref:Malate dehydrogenase n=2 Tax=Sulfurospirillum multivorans TaxID=66821 RepID=A0AA86ALJ6_SULMK|nr:malate dehydrogenase [Sulfurospirillum multivorans]AHJ12704.1 malate dehydrogenase [Sulfurospirillum multivorans DSM 12446]QEH06199.1 malate dehydrogenase [Sulfurospirillum multivorans]
MSQGKKVSIIGAGNVGATVCYWLAMRKHCREIVMIDRYEGLAQGKALDILQATSPEGSHTQISSSSDYHSIANSNIVVITAGSPRKPGMSRDDLLMINANITKEIIEKITHYAPNAIIIIVSNPLDAMTYVALKVGHYARNRVIGMAGILDSSRMETFISQKLGFGYGQVTASVMGGHGDDMVPLPRYSSVNGVALTDLLTDVEIEEIIEKTRHGGAEIVSYMGTSGYYAPANSTVKMIEAILSDSRSIFPCAVLLEGEYGYHDTVNGVPVVLGANGVEQIVELPLNEHEKKQFSKSVESVNKLLETLHKSEFFVQ